MALVERRLPTLEWKANQQLIVEAFLPKGKLTSVELKRMFVSLDKTSVRVRCLKIADAKS